MERRWVHRLFQYHSLDKHAQPYFWVPDVQQPGPSRARVCGTPVLMGPHPLEVVPSKSQPRATFAGRPIYLRERKPAIPTCRDEVVAAVEALVAGGGAPALTMEDVHAAMVSCGSAWSRETMAKTMLRMTRPARRPSYLELERAEPDLYRVVPSREGLGRP